MKKNFTSHAISYYVIDSEYSRLNLRQESVLQHVQTGYSFWAPAYLNIHLTENVEIYFWIIIILYLYFKMSEKYFIDKFIILE